MIFGGQLANLMTFISLAAAFMSIVFSLEGHFTFACWAVLGSVVFDGLDGQIARYAKCSSEFGKELDSLVDAIAFGVAPAILGYKFVYETFSVPVSLAGSFYSRFFEYHGFHPLAMCALFVYLFCSVFRLAKYNVTPKESLTNYFLGLPTTASGGVLASFILMYREYARVPKPELFLCLELLLAFFMISRVRYLNLDALMRLVGKKIFAVLVILVIIVALFRPEETVFVLSLAYLATCPLIVRIFVNGKSSRKKI
ncbi:MAG: CDP-alcohol phosphatidyltransferase family protein [Candidatus Omnitrophica bacterium]|nr:CDP-alcohol phosphatidyltransferase family protein [Candidatus Omnitrophota bacterium]